MKARTMNILFTLIAFGLLLSTGCSRIEISDPAEDGQNITTPHTLIVKHTGCGTVDRDSFEAWLDKSSDDAQNVTSAFSFNANVWTAADFSLPKGEHTLSVRADVTKGGWCYVGQAADERKFFVAPCTDFETAFGEDFEMAPDTLTLEWGDNTVEKIADGATKIINLPEDSPYLVDGKLPATITLGIKNITAQHHKFTALLWHGHDEIYHNVLVFCNQEPVMETAAVVLTPGNEPVPLRLEGGDILNSPSDDTRAVFFSAKLQVRVYPL